MEEPVFADSVIMTVHAEQQHAAKAGACQAGRELAVQACLSHGHQSAAQYRFLTPLLAPCTNPELEPRPRPAPQARTT